MELLLNVFSLSIALGAFGVWRFIWAPQKRRHPGKHLREFTALACALVFVFFAVSLSDDLRGYAVLSDDFAIKRHHAMAWDCSHASHQKGSQSHPPSAAAPSRGPASAKLQLAERISSRSAHIELILGEISLFGRSPPGAVNSCTDRTSAARFCPLG